MSKKYTPAVFQPTVRPSWAGTLSYISEKERSLILEAIIRFPEQIELESRFWEETIKPDLQEQYDNFIAVCLSRGRGAKTYWGEHKDNISLPCVDHKDNISLPQGELMDNSLKDKDKDKDKDKNQGKDKGQVKDKSNGKDEVNGNNQGKVEDKVNKRACRFENSEYFSNELPDSFSCEAELMAVSDSKARFEYDKFRDYWTAKSGQQATKLDWLATWRNWLRNMKPEEKKKLSREPLPADKWSWEGTNESL